MNDQIIDLSHEKGQQTVWNTIFDDIFTSENVQQQGQILYVGYAFSPQQQPGSGIHTFAKGLRLVALHRENQQILWQRTFTYEVEGMSVYTTLAAQLKVVENIVYLWSSLANGAFAGWLVALDAKTGQDLWQYTGPGGDSGMVVCNGIVFLRHAYLQALDGKNGKVLWSYDFRQQGEILGSSLSTTQDAIFMMGYSRNAPGREVFLRSLHMTTGKELWNVSLGAKSGIFSLYSATLFLIEDTVYVVKKSDQFQADQVMAFRVQDGTPLWTSQSGLYEKPLLVQNDVLLVSGGELLSALNASTGSPLWSQRIEGRQFFSAVPDGGLYGFDSATLYFSALDSASGKMLWFSKRGRSQTAGACLAIDQTSIYMITNNHNEIVLLERATGNERHLLSIEGNEAAERFQLIAIG